jgi:hypothetical protein
MMFTSALFLFQMICARGFFFSRPALTSPFILRTDSGKQDLSIDNTDEQTRRPELEDLDSLVSVPSIYDLFSLEYNDVPLFFL